MKYIDAHCHIMSDEYMCAAMARGVGQFIVNGQSPADWKTVAEIARRDNFYGAIGVHPWSVSELPDDWDARLVDMLSANPKLMIGEIGLDKNRPNMTAQEAVFCRQLQIAHEMERVVQIHMVGAWGRCMEILRGGNLPPGMVFHAFPGPGELVGELSNMKAYFSFGPGICDEKYIKMRAAVGVVPESRILVESDAPDFLSPDAVPNTVAEIARIRGVPVKEMAEIIYNNTLGIIHDGKI